MFYRLQFDPALLDQWFVGTPVDCSGDEWAFRRLVNGEALDQSDLRTWRAMVKKEGRDLPFSFAGFDVPIVSHEVGELIAALAPGQVQLPPVEVDGLSAGFHVLVATQTVRCIDEVRSEFTRWGAHDGRPNKVGEYRMFTRLRLDPTIIPKDLQIFRVLEWRGALVVTESLAESLRACVKAGLIYEPVA